MGTQTSTVSLLLNIPDGLVKTFHNLRAFSVNSSEALASNKGPPNGQVQIGSLHKQIKGNSL